MEDQRRLVGTATRTDCLNGHAHGCHRVAALRCPIVGENNDLLADRNVRGRLFQQRQHPVDPRCLGRRVLVVEPSPLHRRPCRYPIHGHDQSLSGRRTNRVPTRQPAACSCGESTRPLTPDTGRHRPPATTLGARSARSGGSGQSAWRTAGPTWLSRSSPPKPQTRYPSATTRNLAQRSELSPGNRAHLSPRGVSSRDLVGSQPASLRRDCGWINRPRSAACLRCIGLDVRPDGRRWPGEQATGPLTDRLRMLHGGGNGGRRLILARRVWAQSSSASSPRDAVTITQAVVRETERGEISLTSPQTAAALRRRPGIELRVGRRSCE